MFVAAVWRKSRDNGGFLGAENGFLARMRMLCDRRVSALSRERFSRPIGGNLGTLAGFSARKRVLRRRWSRRCLGNRFCGGVGENLARLAASLRDRGCDTEKRSVPARTSLRARERLRTRPPEWREGVKWIEQARTDLLAFTLDKTSGNFSPTTSYRDRAISRELIRWESQSMTGADSETGRRYREHVARAARRSCCSLACVQPTARSGSSGRRRTLTTRANGRWP